MRLLSIITLLLIGSISNAQDLAARLQQIEANNAAIQKAKSKKASGNDCGCSFGGICRCGSVCACNGELPSRGKRLPSYAEACTESIKTGKPLLVWVCRTGGYVVPLDGKELGAVVCQVPSLEGYKLNDVVLAMPVNGDVIWKETLPLGVWYPEARAAIARAKVVSRQAEPFRLVQQFQSRANCST